MDQNTRKSDTRSDQNLKKLIQHAEKTTVQMPWTRGARRQEMIKRRESDV